MPEIEARFAASQPIGGIARISAVIDRIRPAVIVLGLLALGVAFGVAAWAIQKDYLLRVAGLWNGVTGPARGISAHASNKAMAELAVQVMQWTTGVVGLALLVPRRKEGAFFRFTAWLSLLFAVVFFAASLLGLVGIGLHHAAVLFDPTCTLDGPCDHARKAIPPDDWRLSYLGGLAVAATLIAAIFAACLGVRWVFWGITRLLRGARSTPTGV
ncbi:hypothetical protein KEG38_41000 [Polyangium jinanense]|uniref:hypothetical protein n=1 Tax=Polyangium jinanense TaxID=2829994 RepID=UPI002341AE2D|nr:hypothetical protein [Polyangium jinanense]MDC3960303.1 hypothetical protein [Polyangium jinanense]